MQAKFDVTAEILPIFWKNNKYFENSNNNFNRSFIQLKFNKKIFYQFYIADLIRSTGCWFEAGGGGDSADRFPESPSFLLNMHSYQIMDNKMRVLLHSTVNSLKNSYQRQRSAWKTGQPLDFHRHAETDSLVDHIVVRAKIQSSLSLTIFQASQVKRLAKISLLPANAASRNLNIILKI